MREGSNWNFSSYGIAVMVQFRSNQGADSLLQLIIMIKQQ